ncbi:NAD-dependent epimerase/dehydratase family protein [Candidatus Pacearchaeota archaeon]|nr:NAD-dependent epimerase/dehydratase family protein [Candidatus Pacearchaeota archaeon]
MTKIDTEFYHEKKVLLLGGFGFIGENLLKRLFWLHAKPSVVSRARKDEQDAYQHLDVDYFDPFEDFIKLGPYLRNADIVFNLISPSRQDVTRQHALSTLNFDILNFCVKEKINPILVHVGSRLQYSLESELPINEDAEMKPTTAYGLERVLSENHYRLFNEKGGLKTICLRVANLYGPSENLVNRKGLVNGLVYSALFGKMQINGDVNRLKDVLYVDDFIDALLLLIPEKSHYGEAFNVGSGDGIKMIDIARKVKDVFKYNQEIQVEGVARDDFSFYLDISKIKLREGLIKMKEGLEELEVKK